MHSQTPSYFQYETSNGLPSNEVYDIKQDQQGFLWFGTEAGLVKYDGTNFKLYNNNQSRGNAVSCLREDKFGRIWCTNFSGQIFYATLDSLALFIPFEKLYKTNYAEIDFDENDNLIVTSGVNHLYKFDISTSKFTVISCRDNSTALTPYKAFNKSILFTVLGNHTQLLNLNNSKLSEVLFF